MKKLALHSDNVFLNSNEIERLRRSFFTNKAKHIQIHRIVKNEFQITKTDVLSITRNLVLSFAIANQFGNFMKAF